MQDSPEPDKRNPQEASGRHHEIPAWAFPKLPQCAGAGIRQAENADIPEPVDEPKQRF